MHPVLLEFGRFRLYSYGALIALGGLLSVLFWRRKWRAMGLRREEDLWLLVNVMLLGGFAGGKILFAFEYTRPLSAQFWRSFVSLNQGFSVMGAFVSVFLALFAACRSLKAPFPRVLDYVCQAAPFWHAFGRLGCFAAGCCFGRPTDEPWGVTFTDPRSMVPSSLLGHPLHPTQLYEAGGNLAIAAALYFFVLPKTEAGRLRPGTLSACYFGAYAALRFLMEFFRADAVPTPVLGLTAAQGFCLLLAALSAAIVASNRHASDPR